MIATNRQARRVQQLDRAVLCARGCARKRQASLHQRRCDRTAEVKDVSPFAHGGTDTGNVQRREADCAVSDTWAVCNRRCFQHDARAENSRSAVLHGLDGDAHQRTQAADAAGARQPEERAHTVRVILKTLSTSFFNSYPSGIVSGQLLTHSIRRTNCKCNVP